MLRRAQREHSSLCVTFLEAFGAEIRRLAVGVIARPVYEAAASRRAAKVGSRRPTHWSPSGAAAALLPRPLPPRADAAARGR